MFTINLDYKMKLIFFVYEYFFIVYDFCGFNC